MNCQYCNRYFKHSFSRARHEQLDCRKPAAQAARAAKNAAREQPSWMQEYTGYQPNDSTFDAWAEFPGGFRDTFTGSGPEISRWMRALQRAGASRVGYDYSPTPA